MNPRGFSHSKYAPKRERGVMLIEALLAILIFSIGILAVVGMQGVAVKDLAQAKYRSEAAFLTNQLLAQMWTDNGNISSYAYGGTGTVPTRLATWVNQVTAKLPGATTTPPTVQVSGPSASGGTVQIQIFWILPEEASLGLPAHNHTVIAAVFTS